MLTCRYKLYIVFASRPNMKDKLEQTNISIAGLHVTSYSPRWWTKTIDC